MKALKFFKPRESFLIIEISPEKISGLLLGLGSDKKLTARKYWEETSWAKMSRRQDLRHLVKNIIVAADSNLAYTATVPVTLDREDPKEPLSSAELENLLSRAVSKVFNQCRQEAGRYLKVDDLDIVLAASRVVNFKIDGHHVLNPLDFSAKRIETVLELTLTVRNVLDSLKSFLKNGRNFYFTEIARAELVTLGQREKGPISLLYLGENNSMVLTTDPSPIGHIFSRGHLRWQTKDILRALAREWSLPEESARAIYGMHLEKKLSERGHKSVHKIIEPVRKSLIQAIDASSLRGKVYLDSSIPLFIDLPLRRGKASIEGLPVKEVVQHFGFIWDCSECKISEYSAFRMLAPFLEYYYDHSDTTLNRWLKRHLSWLGAPLNTS